MRTKLFLSVLLILFCFSSSIADEEIFRIKVNKPTISDNNNVDTGDSEIYSLEGVKYHECNWWCNVMQKFFKRCCVGYKARKILL